ncbi:MAG: hypothetical protein VB139_07145 [Coriobacteriia bacterium]|nr:hypothetical protein [Coriobacteriia bacterium]
MKSSKSIALVALGLTAGLVLGSVGVSFAATETTSTNPVVCAGAKMGQSIRDAGGRLVDIVAELTGLSADEVQAERAAGKSAADIAEANGSSAEEVVSAALETRKTLLDERVADGTLTQEQADLMYDRMSERLTERVSTDETGRPSWGGMGGGRGGRGGMGGQGACGNCTITQ